MRDLRDRSLKLLNVLDEPTRKNILKLTALFELRDQMS